MKDIMSGEGGQAMASHVLKQWKSGTTSGVDPHATITQSSHSLVDISSLQDSSSSSRRSSYPTPHRSVNFPELPLELRLMIWKLLLPDGVIVMGSSDSAGKKQLRKPPITASINRESRAETLKHYQVLSRADCSYFGSDFAPNPNQLTFWSKEKDTLCVSFRQFFYDVDWKNDAIAVQLLWHLPTFVDIQTELNYTVKNLRVFGFRRIRRLSGRLIAHLSAFRGLVNVCLCSDAKQELRDRNAKEFEDLWKEAVKRDYRRPNLRITTEALTKEELKEMRSLWRQY